MATPKQGTEGSAETPAKIRPVVAIADVQNRQKSQIQKRLGDEGLDVLFIETPEQLINEVSRPEVFCVLLSFEFGGNGLATLKRMAAGSHAHWVLLCGNVSTQIRSTAFSYGAADLLQLPTNPVQILLRVRVFLGKWAQKHNYADTIELPTGYSWSGVADSTAPTLAAPTAPTTQEKKSIAAEASGPDVTFVKGGPASEAAVTFVKGAGAAAKPVPFSSKTTGADVERAFRMLDAEASEAKAEFRPTSPPRARAPYQMLYDDVRVAGRPLPALNAADRAALELAGTGASFPFPVPGELGRFDLALKRLRGFLKEESSRVSALRLSIVSTRFRYEVDATETTKFVSIASGDSNIPFNEVLERESFPQIHMSCLERKALYFDRAFEAVESGGRFARPSHWNLSERASVAFPVCGDRFPELLLFAQMSRSLNDGELIPLRGLGEMLSRHPNAWRTIDFLARIYRDITP